MLLPPKTQKDDDEDKKEEIRFNIFGAEMADLQELISSVISKHPTESRVFQGWDEVNSRNIWFLNFI